jgi:hypothetical protein
MAEAKAIFPGNQDSAAHGVPATKERKKYVKTTL